MLRVSFRIPFEVLLWAHPNPLLSFAAVCQSNYQNSELLIVFWVCREIRAVNCKVIGLRGRISVFS